MTFRVVVLSLLLVSAVEAADSVHGSCQVGVSVQSGPTALADCELITADRTLAAVPEATQLRIEYATAHCTAPQAGEIAYLAILTRISPKASAQPAYLSLTRRANRSGTVQTRYLASDPVTLYAGGRTKVSIKLTLDPEVPTPLGPVTACEVRFQGRLEAVE